jgi:predicted RND superfamily exporter protein
VFGFSILVLSNFIPTIYFCIFTGLAMMLAMVSVLTLLPKLILIFKPFGEEISQS